MPNINWEDPKLVSGIIAHWNKTDFETVHRDFLCNEWINKKIVPKDTILEVGCGSGLIYKRLTNKKYTGLDYSSEMLKVFKEDYPNVKLLQGDIHSLPFKDRSMDVVVCIDVLSHLEQPIDTSIAELFRVSKRKVLFTIWSLSQTQDFRWMLETDLGNMPFPYVGYSLPHLESMLKCLPCEYKLIEFERVSYKKLPSMTCSSYAVEMWRENV